jgi:hypothetical protein
MGFVMAWVAGVLELLIPGRAGKSAPPLPPKRPPTPPAE